MAQEEYVVEDILGEKHDRSRHATVYEIKWKGFPSDENTWETREDMIADGYEREILAYEARKASGVPASAKKKTPTRNARSKTPIKRTVAVKDSTPGRKLDYSTEEKPAKSTPVFAETETARDSLKHLLIGGAIMAITVALSREKDAFSFVGGENFALALPAIVGLITLQLLGRNAEAVSRSSVAMLWITFSILLSSPLLPESPLLTKVASLVWRLFVAFSVGGDIRDVNVTFVTMVTWFVCTGMSLSLDFSKISLLFSVWASITAIDKWTERRTLLNFIEALSTCAVIVSCFASEEIYLWTGVSLLVISNVARA